MKAPTTLRKFDRPEENLHLESVNELLVANHSLLTVKTETTGWEGEGNRHGGSATVRFECEGVYESTIRPSRWNPNSIAMIEFTGIGKSEIRSLLIGFEFAAASLRVLLNEPPMAEPDEDAV